MVDTGAGGKAAGWDWTSAAEVPSPVDLRTDVPHSARMYDYYLGGKNNFEADRAAVDQALASFPTLRTSALQNRFFMGRTTRYLAREMGIRQFLDIGTGLPTSPNLHEVAQGIAPECRVVYVDNDPIVLVHARALLTSSPEGVSAYVDADLRQPARILASPQLTDTLDLSRPVALSLISIVHFLPDSDDPYGIVATLMDALPSGSYLALTHVTGDFAPEAARRAIEVYRAGGITVQIRDRDEVGRFFVGLDLVEPGVQVIHRWRPEDASGDGLADVDVSVYGALARKP
jgi:S-adenosyl methyltransferase